MDYSSSRGKDVTISAILPFSKMNKEFNTPSFSENLSVLANVYNGPSSLFKDGFELMGPH